ncbi:hypothetical protein DFJ74DRAFT_709436 [Hyaloraphidium curvatum]|nr:hypothetical protein DFJ74DRAFT_709436 [Hyaloraphidium curvatum]
MRFLILAVVATVWAAAPAAACSCLRPPPPRESLKQSSAVFLGKVTALHDTGPDGFRLTVDMDVSRIWKGVDSQVVKVMTTSNSAACGVNFEKGTRYLVYANAQDDGLWANLCSRTAREKDAADDLKELGPGAPPAGAKLSSEAPAPAPRYWIVAGGLLVAAAAFYAGDAGPLGAFRARREKAQG